MYVVPHGNNLADYRLPENPVASPGPLAALNVVKRVGSYLFGMGILSTALHFLAFGPQDAADLEETENTEDTR